MRISAISATAVAAFLMVAGCQTTQEKTESKSAAMMRVTPFLMFQDGRSEEAINRYVEIFRDARVVSIKRYGANPVGAKEGSIQQAEFEIYGQRLMVTESPAKHVFGFTPSVSLFVDFESREELDRVFAALSEGGEVMMPPDNYFFSKRFAFLQDRYGVSWQLDLPSE